MVSGATWIRPTAGERAFDGANYAFLALFMLAIILPFVHIVSISLSPAGETGRYGLRLWPSELTFANYAEVITNPFIQTGYLNTIYRTVLGTAMCLTATTFGGYVLSKRYYPHRTFWTLLVVFTMFFNGGLIPTYLVVRGVGLLDNRMSLILPQLVAAFNLIIMRNYFAAMSPELEESARMDGANTFSILFRIVLPLSAPILATIALWVAVGHWNQWFDQLIYIQDTSKYVVQVVLRRIVLTGTQEIIDLNPASMNELTTTEVSPDGLKAAAVFFVTAPILCVYPFIQKYFIKGIMIGSLKG